MGMQGGLSDSLPLNEGLVLLWGVNPLAGHPSNCDGDAVPMLKHPQLLEAFRLFEG